MPSSPHATCPFFVPLLSAAFVLTVAGGGCASKGLEFTFHSEDENENPV